MAQKSLMVRILLIDPQEVVRRGLKQIILEADMEAAFGDAASGQEALLLARSLPWDIVILNLSPDQSGLEVLRDLRGLRPEVPVLILSMHPEAQLAVRALRRGAAGYVNQQTATGELVTAIRRLLGGGTYVSPSVTNRLAFEIGNASQGLPHETLSDREFQVFRLLAFGHRVKQIGHTLGLSPQTISTHRTRLLEKLDMVTNADLTLYALQHHLLDQ